MAAIRKSKGRVELLARGNRGVRRYLIITEHDHIYLYCTSEGYAINDTSDGITEYALQTEGNSFPDSI